MLKHGWTSKNIILVDRSQMQKATWWFYLYIMCRKVDLQRRRNDALLPQCELFFKGECAQDNMAMVRREHGGWPFWNLTGDGTEKQPTWASPAPHPFVICFRCFSFVSVIARKCNEIENFSLKLWKGSPTPVNEHTHHLTFLCENI